MKTISITEKLILYFVSLGIVVITIVGSYSYYFIQNALLNRTFDQLKTLREEKKNRIEQFFIDRNHDINLISKSEEIKKIIQIINNPNSPISNQRLLEFNSYLNKYINSHGYYQRLYVTNMNGFVVTINPHDSINQLSNETGEACNDCLMNFINELKTSDHTIIRDVSKTQLLLYLGSRITDEKNKTVGLIVLEIPLSAINKIMFGYSQNNGLGESGETYLVGSDSLMRSNSRFTENAVLNIKVNSLAVQKASQGITGTDIVYDYRNIRCLSSYSRLNIKGLTWYIMAEIDEQEAMIPVNSIRNSILLISIIIAASVFIIAFFVSRKITQPIKKLQKASEEIGAGNYDIKLTILSGDELGSLTETFNTMSMQLKKQKEEIELQKTKRFNSLIDGQEMERQRLSRDLHDGLGQSLLAVKMKLENLKNKVQLENQPIIQETQELLGSTIQEIRHISSDLMPAVLEAFGLEQGLKNLCKETKLITGIDIEYHFENIPENLNKRIKIYLYRIIQEAFNNIGKHSSASKVILSLSFNKSTISLNISDNGKGFDTEKDVQGNGIVNIKQRVELLKGECNLISSKTSGTIISIKIPI